jgi:virulence-associated protein VagC
MQNTADIYSDGGRQTIRLPEHIHLSGSTVRVRQDLQTGDVILSAVPTSDWESFFKLLDESGPAEDEFMQGTKDPVTAPEDVF